MSYYLTQTPSRYYHPPLARLAELTPIVRADCLDWHRHGRHTYQVPDEATYQEAKRYLRRCLLAARAARRPLPLP